MSFAEDVKNELCAYEPETDTDVASISSPAWLPPPWAPA